MCAATGELSLRQAESVADEGAAELELTRRELRRVSDQAAEQQEEAERKTPVRVGQHAATHGTAWKASNNRVTSPRSKSSGRANKLMLGLKACESSLELRSYSTWREFLSCSLGSSNRNTEPWEWRRS